MVAYGLKICILGTAYPFKGGIASFNERLAKALIEAGNEVEIVTFTTQYPDFFYPGKNQFTEDAPPENLKISRKLSSINPLSWLQTKKYIKERDYDLVISKFWIPVVGISLGSVLKGVKNSKTRTVAIIDNIIPHEKRMGDDFFTTYFMSSIDGCVCMSKKVLDQTEELFSAKPKKLIPHPVYDNYGDITKREIALDKLNLAEGKEYLLFFGFIRAYKGLDWLIEAFAMVHNEIPDVEIIIAGEFYEDSAKYNSLIKKHGLSAKIHMHTDFISNEKVKYYFSVADLVGQTYKNATQSGISQMAIHFEKPILSTDVGGLKENIEEGINGLVCPPNIPDIAQCIKAYFTSPNKYYDPLKYHHLKAGYSWESFAKNILEFKKSLETNVDKIKSTS